MDKKKILIIVGVVAVAGIGFYLWNKSKKTAETGGAEGGGETKAPTTNAETKSAEATETTATAKKPLTSRKEKKKACGRRPVLKKKRAEWQKCVDAGGSAFEGDEYDDFEGDYSNVISENYDLFEGEEYIDFDGEEEQLQSIIYSEFENNLNLDL